MADEEETPRLHLPSMYFHMSCHWPVQLTATPGHPHELLHNWYEAALLFLNHSDFMRQINVRTVQAIAILGMCFYNFGDSELNAHLWSCAIRIAKALGLDGSRSDQPSIPLSKEAQCRLWWTLVICEW
jgi:hypothetical protein